jgi:hypothetical protein
VQIDAVPEILCPSKCWMMAKVQMLDNPKCDAPSTESFRNELNFSKFYRLHPVVNKILDY